MGVIVVVDPSGMCGIKVGVVLVGVVGVVGVVGEDVGFMVGRTVRGNVGTVE
jgi:hypothetical protein